MSAVLGLAAAVVALGVSGTGLGWGIACVAEGEAGAGCVLLVLGPVLVGLPLAGALGIWGAAEQGWLGRWASDEEGEGEGVVVDVAQDRPGQAEDERDDASGGCARMRGRGSVGAGKGACFERLRRSGRPPA